MLRRLCRECGNEMSKKLTPEGERFFCNRCESHTRFDEVDMDPFCPQCGGILEFCSKCGGGYFCSRCNDLISSKKISWKPK